MRVRDETVSIWSYTNRPEILSNFLNCMYEPNVGIIWPSVAPVSLVSLVVSVLLAITNFLPYNIKDGIYDLIFMFSITGIVARYVPEICD